MGFLQKIFRRKSSSDNNSSTTSPVTASPVISDAGNSRTPSSGGGTRKTSWKSGSNRKLIAPNQGQRTQREDSPTQLMVDDVAFIPPSINSSSNQRKTLRGPDVSDGTQRPVLTPRSHNASSHFSSNINEQSKGVLKLTASSSSPVDLDDSRESESESAPNEKPESIEPPHPKSTSPIFTMPDSGPVTMSLPKLRFSAGNVSVGSEDTDGGESSSFNLSTDAEDTEYEAMRRRLGAAGVTSSSLHMNNMDMSVTNYTTDGETSVFPGLQSEDDATQTTASVTKEAAQNSILHLPTVNPATGASLVPYSHPYAGTAGFPGAAYPNRGIDPGETHGNSQGRPSSKPKEEVVSSSRFGKKDPESSIERLEVVSSSSRMPVSLTSASNSAPAAIPALEISKRDSPDPKRSPKVAAGKSGGSNSNNSSFTQYNSQFLEAIYGTSEGASQRRSFTSPKKTTEKPATTTATFEPFVIDNTTDFTSGEDLFADFADFSNFENAFQDPPKPVPPAVVGRSSAALESNGRPTSSADRTNGRITSVSSTSSAKQNRNAPMTAGAIQNDTSLSELLEKAKSKSSRNNSTLPKKTSSSVNSAPAMTSSYLRQHHNLGKPRSSREGTSVTDIIQSLEAANATRVSTTSSSRSLVSGGGRHSHPTTNGGGGNSSRDDGFSSNHSRDGVSSVMSAREKLRRRRERRQQRGADAHSSDSEDELEENESWLFDEVTGALGPRGIAADLESLSGRSNRSNSSRGNKSHRSHRSHKSGSRSSRHRRPKSDSADSVDSHHSRDSRRSRGSRYSHRSTRSYISQMSEQSRSVANDLLRLEMQLAMVGSAGVAGLEGGSSSVGGIARSNRSLSSRSNPPVTAQSSSAAMTSGVGSRRTATARRSRITIQAPPGRLGIILANKADARGTVVSGIRSSSALVDRISPGDRIVAIDGEDVSLMTVSEITTIMARKADFERTLTVLTTPRHADAGHGNSGGPGSPRPGGDSYHQHRSYRG
jgi:PDZ domain